MKNKLFKVIAIVAVAALMLPMFTSVTSSAKNVEASPYIEVISTSYKTLKDTVKVGETTIKLTTTYPVVKLASDQKALQKTVNKLIKNAAYKDVLKTYRDNEAAGDSLGKTTVTITVDARSENDTNGCAGFYHTGNVISVAFMTSSMVKGGAYPTTVYDSININLETGKKLTFKGSFVNSNKLRTAVQDKVKGYFDLLTSFADFGIELPEIDWSMYKKAVKNNWGMDDIVFVNSSYAYVILNEGEVTTHAIGALPIVINMDELAPYISKSLASAFSPASVYKITLVTNPSTGYEWDIADQITATGKFTIVEDSTSSMSLEAIFTGMVGAPLTRTICIVANEVPSETVKVSFTTSYDRFGQGDPAETMTFNLTITPDGLIKGSGK